MKKYPDVTQLLKQKAERRTRLALLSFEEKIAIVNRLRKLTESIQRSNRSIKSRVSRKA